MVTINKLNKYDFLLKGKIEKLNGDIRINVINTNIKTPCVYILALEKGNGKVTPLYIGKERSLRARTNDHNISFNRSSETCFENRQHLEREFENSETKINLYAKKCGACILFGRTVSISHAEEDAAIKVFNPLWNWAKEVKIENGRGSRALTVWNRCRNAPRSLRCQYACLYDQMMFRIRSPLIDDDARNARAFQKPRV